MSMPYVVSQEVWLAKALTETKALDPALERCKVVVVEITTTGFTGTIDIQGKVHESGAFSNVPWVLQGTADLQTPSIAQVSPSGDTSVKRYVILGFWRRLQIIMTRSGGTITCGVAGSSHGQLFPRITIS